MKTEYQHQPSKSTPHPSPALDRFGLPLPLPLPEWASVRNHLWTLPCAELTAALAATPGMPRYDKKTRKMGPCSALNTAPDDFHDYVEKLNFPRWIAEAIAIRLESLPQKLVEEWYSEYIHTDSHAPDDAIRALLQADEAMGGRDVLLQLSIDIDARNAEIYRAAETAAIHCEKMLSLRNKLEKKTKIIAPRTASFYPAIYAEQVGVDTGNLTENKLEARLVDPSWWRKSIRKRIRRMREMAWISIAPKKIKWVSNDGKNERKTIIETATKWALSTEFRSNTGEVAACPTPDERDKKYQSETICIANGLAELSGADGAWLATLTLPSRYHPTSTYHKDSKKWTRRNPKYDGSTPREGIDRLQLQWARTRAALKRRGVGQFWFSAIQPHRDETPHAHVVFLSRGDEEPKEIEKILLKNFRDTEREKGDNRRVDWRRLGDKTAGIKYISKAVSYIAKSAEDTENESSAIAQWASSWGVRRFRSSHGRRTLWRLSRAKGILDDNDALHSLAKSNKYADWYRLATSLCAKAYKDTHENVQDANDYGQPILRRCPITNKYGEPTSKLAGIELGTGVVFRKKVLWKQVARGERVQLIQTTKKSHPATPNRGQAVIQNPTEPKSRPPTARHHLLN